jgi:hypothetical protein
MKLLTISINWKGLTAVHGKGTIARLKVVHILEIGSTFFANVRVPKVVEDITVTEPRSVKTQIRERYGKSVRKRGNNAGAFTRLLLKDLTPWVFTRRKNCTFVQINVVKYSNLRSSRVIRKRFVTNA